MCTMFKPYIVWANTDKMLRRRLEILLTVDERNAGMTFDMKYHLPCLKWFKRNAKQPEKIDESSTAQMYNDS